MRLAFSLLLAMLLTPAISVATALCAGRRRLRRQLYRCCAGVRAAPAVGLLRQLANASRKDEGNLRFDILQRAAPPNQFAIVAVWKDQKAYDAHAAAAHSKDFREKIKPHLISAIDDRVHTGMEIAAAGSEKLHPARSSVVTHVDVPPPRKDECVAALKALVADSRKEPGALSFEVFQQGNRPNSTSRWSKCGRTSVPTMPTSRRRRPGHSEDQLTPMSGALYDERLYRAI